MNFIKHRNIFFIISIVTIVIGMALIGVRGLNYGIDFTGGTLIQIDLEKQVPVNEVKKIVSEFDKNASVIHAGKNKEEVIIKSSLSLSRKESGEIFNKFKEKYNLKADQPKQVQAIGASMGNEIRNKALLSIVISSIGILIYITFRFEIDFGLSAIISLVHDILLMFSIYSIFKFPIDSTFIAAILTIIGYSINDTIIIFDRIRENLKITNTRDYENLINSSIKQTIRRTLGTSFTTLVTITLLYVLGVEAIKEFTLPLIIGILIGTYSSIFVASPIWYILKTKKSQTN
ncbi:protein-export membrane protein SecF [Gottschalkia acidurici 9a]|uniref:Protein-export membrane protein SecF n=1 Tax=Gottschalkia acidurici (strain ATCC 7906 / DSM 604 / BCRC 14475 / CIP 104303 / KCTC 5404 / NCIMB 10678 / 9a) TaxID=1128398 RepID=K0AY86_GOTA9|nr:protein translocase subunit SecF [Gottschalkia acidurici]AFS78748.1 protein-export membrane protein SecF [Gottschalkia acidurici 9a]